MKRKKVKKIFNKELPFIYGQHTVEINDVFIFYTGFKIEKNLLRLLVDSENLITIRFKDIKLLKRFS